MPGATEHAGQVESRAGVVACALKAAPLKRPVSPADFADHRLNRHGAMHEVHPRRAASPVAAPGPPSGAVFRPAALSSGRAG